MRHPVLGLAISTVCIVVPGLAAAQAPIYLRLTPEIGILRVKHTKVLTESAGKSTGTGIGTGTAFAGGLTIGQLRSTEGGLLVGGELQLSISTRQATSGSMGAQGTGVGAVGQGTWELTNSVGVGVNAFLGRKLEYRDLSSYLTAGFRRWSTETSSRAVSILPVVGEFQDREVAPRWSLSAGVGVTFPGERPIDLRLRYFRSDASWSRTHQVDPESEDLDPETITWDYTFSASGIGFQLGFGTG